MAVPTGLEPASSCGVITDFTTELYWHRIMDLNHVHLDQSQMCYLYTNPVYGTLCRI